MVRKDKDILFNIRVHRVGGMGVCNFEDRWCSESRQESVTCLEIVSDGRMYGGMEFKVRFEG